MRKPNSYANAAFHALILGIAEAQQSVTTNCNAVSFHGSAKLDLQEFYDVGREIGCAALGIPE